MNSKLTPDTAAEGVKAYRSGDRSLLKRIIYLFFSLLVTVSVFYYLFSHITLQDLVTLLKEINRPALLVFVICSFTMSFFRVWRYLILLKAAGYAPAKGALFLVVLVRNFFSDLLPARLGTAIYIYLVNSRLKIPLAPASASFALAFIFDLLAMVPIIVITTAFVATGTLINAKILMLSTLALGVILYLFLSFLPAMLKLTAEKILPLLEPIKILSFLHPEKLAKLCEDTAREVESAKDAGIYGQVMTLSVLVRAFKYGALFVFLFALLEPLGYSLADIPAAKVLLSLLACEFAASLPISGIGAFGLYEGTWAFTFEFIGFPKNIAALTAVSHHLFTQVYGYLLGVAALLLLLLPFFAGQTKTSEADFKKEGLIKFYIKIILSLTLVFVLSALSFAAQGGGKEKIQSAKQEIIKHQGEEQPAYPLSESSLKKRQALAAALQGEILFDSNRSGSFGIYAVKTDGTALRKVVDKAKWEEMYPDPAPDGLHIVYARARTTSRLAPSSIWEVDREGKNARLIVDNGTFPTYSADGKYIYFERNRKLIMRVKRDGSAVEQLFPPPEDKNPFKRHQLVKPRFNSDGSWVAFTSDRKGAWNAWAVELDTGRAVRLGFGCEPAWFNESGKLAYIFKKDALAGSGISSFYLNGGNKEVLHDDGAPWGHEYFPTPVSDRFIFHSASPADQHSHITANYQLYVFDLKRDENVRLTNDPYTNRWPKLLRADE